tara:strand:- start:546 stop:1160 length:615 start_codon:yes stop_codon:yes gene_type:complete
MDILNYLSKLATGYHSRSLKISGIHVKFKFYGKPVPFDPIAMFRELHFISDSLVCPHLNGREDFLDFAHHELDIEQDLPALVIASFHLDGVKYKVVRSVKSLENPRCSRYIFYASDKMIAVYQRTYDYGQSFDKLSAKFLENLETPHRNNQRLIKVVVDSGKWILLEGVVNSQLWLITDPDCITDVLQKIVSPNHLTIDHKQLH